jgi:acyl carrier protein
MSLDTVELVERVEMTFGLDLPNDDWEKIRTVGDIYLLVLKSLKLPYIAASEVERIESSVPAGRDRSRVGSLVLQSWATPDVWVTLKNVIWDQLQVDPDDIKESASLLYDLGCD